mmetsp:Transcript_45259/g.121992  ORF Transcript_45259/g.121992 Transcript_45259/m.121992 type:complete len:225 (-) Transcript_45259:469-1143(-)
MLIRLLQEAGEQHRLPEIGVEDLVLLVVLHLHRHAPQRLRPNRAALLHDLVERPVGDLLHQVVRGLLQGDQAGGHPELDRAGVGAEHEPGEGARAVAQPAGDAARVLDSHGRPAEVHDEEQLEPIGDLALGRGGVAAEDAALRDGVALRHPHLDGGVLGGAGREDHATCARVVGRRELEVDALRRARLRQGGAEEVWLPDRLLRGVLQPGRARERAHGRAPAKN